MKALQVTQDFLQALEEAIADGVETTIMGTTAAGTGVTAASSLAGVAIGARIQGANIVDSPPTTIVAMSDSAHTLTLSQAATGIGADETLTITNPGPVTNLRVGLYTAISPGVSVASVLADLTEPTYTGYARVVVDPLAIRRNANGDFLIPVESANFQPTDNVGLPQTAIGTFLMGSVGGSDKLLQVGGLDAPFQGGFPFQSDMSGISIQMEVVVPNLLVFGGICSQC